MKDWILSQEGDRWSVKFDVRDLGGHLDTTFRGWSATLAARGSCRVIAQTWFSSLPFLWIFMVVFVLFVLCFSPLLFMESRLPGTGFMIACLSFATAVCRVVWSRRQPLANVGAVLSLFDGPTGCDPAFCVVWFRFRLFRRYLSLWPAEVGRVYRLLEMVSRGCPGHGPVHLLAASAAEIGFTWDPDALAWFRPRLPLLSNLAGLLQHFKAAIFDAWRNKVAADLCGRAGFRERAFVGHPWVFAAP